MRPGVGFPSWSGLATWSGSGWASGYPVTNLSDLVYLTRVARAAAAGYVAAQFVLPAAQAIQLVALANHNLDATGIMRLRLFSGATPDPASFTPVVDTGSISAWPTGSAPLFGADGVTPRYRWTRPIVLSSPVTARSGLLELQSSSGVPIEAGGVEIASWFEWPGISMNRELGIVSNEPVVPLPGGAAHTFRWFTPRQINGQIDFADLGTLTNTWMDFQAANGITRPFCFVHDADDATSWARTALMVTNTALPPLAGAAYRADRLAFKFNEHVR